MDSWMWKTVLSHPHTCHENNFWEAVEVWNQSPNLINKKIFGVKLIDLGFCENVDLFESVLVDVSGKTQDFISSYFDELCLKSDGVRGNVEKVNHDYRLYFKLVLQKRRDTDSFEVTLFDYNLKAAIFVEPILRQSAYCLHFTEKCIDFRILENSVIDIEWFRTVLLPKLTKWMSNYSGVHTRSLSLVPLDLYRTLYSNLKLKYSSDIWKIWTEVTDPEKFIHEDIAIASYLLLLWRGRPPQRFVDLGCGNGLLVHILNSESHLGIGYDLRARSIWTKYPPSTRLKVQKISPSKDQMLEEVDWIIGNHSDELTPWIPVMATYNSYHCNLFLLPCCAYNFDGTKFRRSDSSRSLYSDYLDYVENICVKCGFNIDRDKLRIPSTKRICFVSNGRSHEISRFDEVKQSVDNLIELSSIRSENQTNNWNITVKLRETEEKVRNCTQIDEELKVSIVSLISEILLKEKTKGSTWNEGNPTSLHDVIKILPSNYLKQLKTQGKGLQTFIKNHHHIFKLENGQVTFRKPTQTTAKTDHWKKKCCWFYNKHPDSCPLEDHQCSYRHSHS